MLKHIILKLLKTKDKSKEVLNATWGKSQVPPWGQDHLNDKDFSPQTMKTMESNSQSAVKTTVLTQNSIPSQNTC